MAKRFREQNIPPDGYRSEGTGYVSVPSKVVREEYTLDGRVIRFFPVPKHRTGRIFYKAVPAGLQEAARSMGLRLVNRESKHGTRASVCLFCQTGEEAEREFKCLFARIRRVSIGYPEVLAFGNTPKEVDKKEERRKRKQRERERQEETHLGRLELLTGTVEELIRERERVERTSPEHLKVRRIAALNMAIVRAKFANR
jgi:hypothetical protein